MTQVVITYNAWDANRAPVPEVNEPELWFRPIATSMAGGLITDREVKGTLNAATGAGSVTLESAPDLLYLPILRWLKNPADPGNRSRGQSEWEPFFPGPGGPIDQLPGRGTALEGIWYGFGDPPEVLRARRDVVYFDISGVPNGKPWIWIDTRFIAGGGA